MYRLAQSEEAELQNYFALDEIAGSLYLRDGLKSLDTGANPLKTFPLSIVPLDLNGKEELDGAHHIYVHLVDCKSYLQLLRQGGEARVPGELLSDKGGPEILALPELDYAEQVMLCESQKPFFGKSSNLGRVFRWLDWKAPIVSPGNPIVLIPDKLSLMSARAPMLSPQRSLYFKDLIEVYRLSAVASGVPSALGSDSQAVLDFNEGSIAAYLAKPLLSGDRVGKAGVIGEIPVTEIVLLVDNANPGLEIFKVPQAAGEDARILSADRGALISDWQKKGWIWLQRLLLFVLIVRVPFLVIIGVAVPTLVYLMRYHFVLVRGVLKPYLLLLLGQIMTMAIASLVMGEGLALWVGFFYTLLRLLQLLGMLRYLRHLQCVRMLHVVRICGLMHWLAGLRYSGMARLAASRLAASLAIARNGIIRPRWLQVALRFELFLWSLNAVGLALHFGIVFRHFFDISPA